MAPREFKIKYVTCIICLLGSADRDAVPATLCSRRRALETEESAAAIARCNSPERYQETEACRGRVAYPRQESRTETLTHSAMFAELWVLGSSREQNREPQPSPGVTRSQYRLPRLATSPRTRAAGLGAAPCLPTVSLHHRAADCRQKLRQQPRAYTPQRPLVRPRTGRDPAAAAKRA